MRWLKKVSSQSFRHLKLSRSSFDHPDPHGIQLNALKDMTLGYIWIHLDTFWQILYRSWQFGLRFHRCFSCQRVDPKDFGLARWKSWASLRHHRTLSIAAMSTCEHSGDDKNDTMDTMGEMKRNDAPNNFSIFFNHFAWLLLEFLKSNDCGTSWCFFVRSWRLSPKATSGSTILAFLRSVESWPCCMHRRCRIPYHIHPHTFNHWNRRNRFLFVLLKISSWERACFCLLKVCCCAESEKQQVQREMLSAVMSLHTYVACHGLTGRFRVGGVDHVILERIESESNRQRGIAPFLSSWRLSNITSQDDWWAAWHV